MTDRNPRSIGRLLIIALALSLVVSGPLSVAGAAASGSGYHAAESPDGFSAAPEDVDPDRVRMNVALAADGSAEWTVEFWVELDDNESTEAFESVAAEIDEDPEPYLTRFADRIDSTVAVATNATDREMSTDGFAVETERQSLAREYGIIRYTFDWHGFAATDGTELRAGDAIEGYYLDDGIRLIVSWPEEYELTSASPEPDDHRENAVIWSGSQTEFVSGEPRVVVSTGTTGSGPSLSTIAIGVAVLGVVGLGVAAWYRRRGSGGVPAPIPGGDDDGDGPAATTDEDVDDEPVPEEFLSNEERVLRLLEERGGRMKQQDVVSALDWTDAKTSKVVSRLREEGKLESFRLGRENVLTLPEAEDAVIESGERQD
ncbi:helix-turn-helix transcriptional regulator [Halosolutus amylolyticus]|uniref:Helix-turn-helix transcriptional regulator n=1 Tax=Halosolutus amylolyticus TaxID=2932267 RepID=A0ABD5PV23_9EURY|nr:hypothetical protein [Halosolutus amylolyticus]